MVAGVVDQNLTHPMSGHPEEMSPAFPIRQLAASEFEVSLVDEHRRSKRLGVPFVAEVMGRESAQLIVNERGKEGECGLIPGFPLSEKSRNLFRARPCLLIIVKTSAQLVDELST